MAELPEFVDPLLPVLFDPDDTPTTARLDITYHRDFLDETRRPQLNNYIRHAQVGRGQHGSVYLCHRIDPTKPIGEDGRRLPVAMKSVKRNNPRAEQFRALRRETLPASPHFPLADRLATTEIKIRKEIAIMKKLRHPHVVRLYEIIDDRLREKIYIVMEYLAGGEIKWHDGNHNPVLTVHQTRRILRDAVLGLEYLHHQGIIHRDIKPANLLWTDDRRQVKIGDFGVSHFCYAQRLAAAERGERDDEGDLFQDDTDLTRRAGTPAFLAPEIVWEHTRDPRTGAPLYLGSPASSSTSPYAVQRPPITAAIDVWALGVTLYCLLAGDTPFLAAREARTAADEYTLYAAICNEQWEAPPRIGCEGLRTDTSEGGQIMQLLDRFLTKDVNDRIGLEGVKATPWVTADLPAPARFAASTTASSAPRITVSSTDAESAMSAVRFHWRWGLGRQIVRGVGMFLRNVGGAGSVGVSVGGPYIAGVPSAAAAAAKAHGGRKTIGAPRGSTSVERERPREKPRTRVAPWSRSRKEDPEDTVGVVSEPALRGARRTEREREKEREREREREKARIRERERDLERERARNNAKGKGKGKERAHSPEPDPDPPQTPETTPRKSLMRPISKSARSLRALSPDRWRAVRSGTASTSTGALAGSSKGVPTTASSKGVPTTATSGVTATAPTAAASGSPVGVGRAASGSALTSPSFSVYSSSASMTPSTFASASTMMSAVTVAIPVQGTSSGPPSSGAGIRAYAGLGRSRGGSDAAMSPTSPVSGSTSASASGSLTSASGFGDSQRRTSRFGGLFHIANWRPTKFSRTPPGSGRGVGASAGMRGVGRGAGGTLHPQANVGPIRSGRSEEGLALRHFPSQSAGAALAITHAYAHGRPHTFGHAHAQAALEAANRAAEGGGSEEENAFTAARRAASWGQGDNDAHPYPYPYDSDYEHAELVSVQSQQSVDQGLNAQEMTIGAGGVFRGAPPFPSGYGYQQHLQQYQQQYQLHQQRQQHLSVQAPSAGPSRGSHSPVSPAYMSASEWAGGEDDGDPASGGSFSGDDILWAARRPKVAREREIGAGPSGVRVQHEENIVQDTYREQDDKDQDIDHDHEDEDDHEEEEEPAPIVYAPAEQAADNLRFGRPAWHKTSSLDGSDDGEDATAVRRRVTSPRLGVGAASSSGWTAGTAGRERERERERERGGFSDPGSPLVGMDSPPLASSSSLPSPGPVPERVISQAPGLFPLRARGPPGTSVGAAAPSFHSLVPSRPAVPDPLLDADDDGGDNDDDDDEEEDEDEDEDDDDDDEDEEDDDEDDDDDDDDEEEDGEDDEDASESEGEDSDEDDALIVRRSDRRALDVPAGPGPAAPPAQS